MICTVRYKNPQNNAKFPLVAVRTNLSRICLPVFTIIPRKNMKNGTVEKAGGPVEEFPDKMEII